MSITTNFGRSDSHSSHVVAEFPDSLLAFELPRGATLEDLATRLAYLGERHAGSPLQVTVLPSH